MNVKLEKIFDDTIPTAFAKIVWKRKVKLIYWEIDKNKNFEGQQTN